LRRLQLCIARCNYLNRSAEWSFYHNHHINRISLTNMFTMLFGAARSAGNRSASSAILRIRNSQIPSRQCIWNPAKRPNSGFSTASPRLNNSQNVSNTIAAAPTPAAAVPVPGWQRLGPLTTFFQFYSKSQSKRPYLTQFVSSLCIFCAGDLGAQYIGGEPYDFKRTLRILAISAGSSIVIFKWYV
jgi:hypothetical protein